MSLFGRRERKRIAALEVENRELRQSLYTVQIDMPTPMKMVGLRKGVWYRVSYQFRAGDAIEGGPMIVDTRQHFIGEENPRPYFDGETPSHGVWQGVAE